MKEVLDMVLQELRSFRQDVNARFHTIETTMERQFKIIDQKFISTDQKLMSIDQQFLLVHRHLDQIDESIQVLSDQQRDDILALVKKTSETKPN